MKIGECYRDNDIMVMILGRDELEYIYYISVQKDFADTYYQIYFAPIHEDHLKEFVDRSELSGVGTPGDIAPQIKSWLDVHNGGKTFFTVEVEKTIDFMLYTLTDNGVSLEDFKKGKDKFGRDQFCFPAIFPTSTEMINENEC